MKTSLILSTYNGEKYIEEQLESLYLQTRKLDDVLILDDKSTDRTVELIKKFIEDRRLTNWNLKVNEYNQGWKKNFWNGIRQTKGDIVFLCDQDDIWDINKIEIMTKVLESNSKIQLLTSSYEPKYENGNVQKVSPIILKSMKNTGEIQKIKFSPSFLYVLRPGCTYAMRAGLWKRCDEFWNEKIPHDAMLWRQALLEDGLYTIDLPLIQWRRFNTNSSNPYREKDRYENYDTMLYRNILDGLIKCDLIYMEQLVNYIEQNHGVSWIEKEKILKKCLNYQKTLERAFEEKSLIYMGELFIKYRDCFYKFRTYVRYVLVILKMKKKR